MRAFSAKKKVNKAEAAATNAETTASLEAANNKFETMHQQFTDHLEEVQDELLVARSLLSGEHHPVAREQHQFSYCESQESGGLGPRSASQTVGLRSRGKDL